MDKAKLYWPCQILGWTIWIVNDAIFYSNSIGFDWYFVQTTLLNISLCIVLTHLLRHFIKKWNWVNLPYNLVVPRIISSVLVMSLILSLVNMPLDIRYVELELTTIDIIQYILYWGKPLMFWALFYYTYHYFEKKRDDEVERVNLQASIRETEAKVLRAQMNPHFMFNALNSIRALILEDPSKAQKGITQLSNILRSSLLADRRKTVSITEELRTVDDYLALEKIRYEERLQVIKEIDEASYNFQIPPMLLQTLTENAIKHGVSKPIKGGFVKLTTAVEPDKLKIIISNTGQLHGTDSGGFGLENTEQRLKLIYGDDSSFKLEQTEKEVVTATICIPIIKEKEPVTISKMAQTVIQKSKNLTI